MSSFKLGRKTNIILPHSSNYYYDSLLNLETERHVSDHLLFLSVLTGRSKATLTTSRGPVDRVQNFIFEGLSPHQSIEIAEWCHLKKTKISLIMSEYYEYKNGNLHVNSTPWYKQRGRFGSDPLTNANARILAILPIINHLETLVFFGDFLDCKNFRKLLPDVPHLHLDYPIAPLKMTKMYRLDNNKRTHRFLFSVPSINSLTRYRRKQLAIRPLVKNTKVASANDYSELSLLLNSVDLALQIPKSRKFVFPSPMRIWINALFGRKTVSTQQVDTVSNIGFLDDFVIFNFWKNYEEILDYDFGNREEIFEKLRSRTLKHYRQYPTDCPQN